MPERSYLLKKEDFISAHNFGCSQSKIGQLIGLVVVKVVGGGTCVEEPRVN